MRTRIACRASSWLFITLLFGPIFARGTEAQDVQRVVPTTVSPEAQMVLGNAGPEPAHLKNHGGIIQYRTDEQCQQIQADVEADWTAASETIRQESGASVAFREMGGVCVCEITPAGYIESRDSLVLIWIHGGGFVLGTAKSAWGGGVRVATYSGIKVISVGYRLAPQHPYPAPLDDCVTVYRTVLDDYAPSKVGVFGGSAGGNLVVSMALKARRENLPLPAVVAAISPWSNLTKRGDSYATLFGEDPVLHSYEAIEWCVHAYLNDVTNATDPLVSPVYADYSGGFPSTLIQTGTRDLFLSNCARLYREMKDAGVDVELSVWEGMWHGFNDEHFPEAKRASREIARFFFKHLNLH